MTERALAVEKSNTPEAPAASFPRDGRDTGGPFRLLPSLRAIDNDALVRTIIVPLVAVVIFLVAWSRASASIETTLGVIPGPLAVWQQSLALWSDHKAERVRADAFYQRQAKRNAEILAADPTAEVSIFPYTGKPTYIDQIVTSLITVFTGFLLASLVAIPLGILCGLSATINAGINPFVQVFRPVSPLAWLPIVTMVVSALYVSTDPMFEK
jgi:nitrate/nitrite transport system permease protein